MGACGIEGPWRRNVSPPGWWALPIAAREPDPRSIRQNYVISSYGNWGWSAAAKTKQLGFYDQAQEDELEEAQREEAGLDGGMASWVYPGCRPSTRMHGEGESV